VRGSRLPPDDLIPFSFVLFRPRRGDRKPEFSLFSAPDGARVSMGSVSNSTWLKGSVQNFGGQLKFWGEGGNC
jgi:hypothetical protein